MIYPDTSFLIALYTPEKNSDQARRYVSQASVPFIHSPFHRLETRTALRARVFRKHLTEDGLRAVFHRIDSDLKSDLLRHITLDWTAALREAEQVGSAYVALTGAPSGDLLHVASALVLNAVEFCTFDLRQAELAKRAGLKIKVWR